MGDNIRIRVYDLPGCSTNNFKSVDYIKNFGLR